jgi:serine/threonine protein phosphatase PrpC
MSDLQVIATQLELSGGIRRDRAECLLDAEMLMPPPAIQKRGALYIITEIDTLRDETLSTDQALCREIQDLILKEYYEYNQTASVTSALRHSLEIANQHLFNRNSALLPPERRGVGITLALLRGTELFLAQMSPTQAYVVHQGQLSLYPVPEGFQRGPRLVEQRKTQPITTVGGQRASYVPALGRYSTIEPLFNRSHFDDGDLLVLCSNSLAVRLNEDQLEKYLLNTTSREALYNLSEFARATGVENGYALSVGVRGDYSASSLERDALERAETLAAIRRAEEGGLINTVGNITASMASFASKLGGMGNKMGEREEYIFESSVPETEMAPVRWKTENEFVDKEPRQAPPPTEPPRQRSLKDLEALLDDNPAADPWLHREEDNLEKPAYLRNRPEPASQIPFEHQQAGVYPAPNRPGHVEVPKPHFAFGQEQEGPVIEAPPPKRRRGAAPDPVAPGQYIDATGPAAGGPPLDSIPTERSSRLQPPRWLLIAGLAVMIGVAFLFLIFAAMSIGGNNDKALEFVKSAESKRVQAQSLASTSPARARLLITEAQQDLEKARKEKSDLKDITITQNALKVTLDNINKVVVPADLRLSLDLSNQAGLKMARAIFSITGDLVYILDTGKGQVLTLDLDGQVKTILKPGDTASGKTFNKPALMARRVESLVVLDESNVVWVYDRTRNSWQATPLGGSTAWTKPARLLDTYQGNLYIVGPAGSQIQRYLSGAYQNNPDSWLSDAAAQSAQMDRAVSMEIDGRIFGLLPNGTFLQMERPNGKNQGEITVQFDLNKNEQTGPVLNSAALMRIGSINYPYFFVVDTEKRILQFDKTNGNLVQQFRSEGKEFDNIRDLLLDEPNQKLYVITDQKILVFRIPAAAPVSGAPVTGTPATRTTPVVSPSPGR